MQLRDLLEPVLCHLDCPHPFAKSPLEEQRQVDCLLRAVDEAIARICLLSAGEVCVSRDLSLAANIAISLEMQDSVAEKPHPGKCMKLIHNLTRMPVCLSGWNQSGILAQENPCLMFAFIYNESRACPFKGHRKLSLDIVNLSWLDRIHGEI